MYWLKTPEQWSWDPLRSIVKRQIQQTEQIQRVKIANIGIYFIKPNHKKSNQK